MNIVRRVGLDAVRFGAAVLLPLVAIVALTTSCNSADSVRVTAGGDAATSTTTAMSAPTTTTIACVPAYRSTRTVVVVSDADPSDAETLSRAFEEIFGDPMFAAQLHRGLGPELAGRYSADALAESISVTRPPGSTAIEVTVEAPDADDAEQILSRVVPTLNEVLPVAPEGQPLMPSLREISSRPPTPIDC